MIYYIRFILILSSNFLILNQYAAATLQTETPIEQILNNTNIQSITPLSEYLRKTPEESELNKEIQLVTLSNGSQIIFKSSSNNSLEAEGELAAFRLSRLLGFPIIPPTVSVNINGTLGTFQNYIHSKYDILEKEKEAFQRIWKDTVHADVKNLKIFSYIFGKWNAGPHNIMVDDNENGAKRLIAIDNSAIMDRQYVKGYGELPFVKIVGSDPVEENAVFPFDSAIDIEENPENGGILDQLKQMYGTLVPELETYSPVIKSQKIKVVFFQNALWRQFYAFEKDSMQHFTSSCPESTLDILTHLTETILNEIFKAAPYRVLEILKRRQEVLSYFGVRFHY